MKKLVKFLCFCSFFAFMTTTTSSCTRKTGCKISENAGVKANRKGQLPTKKGKSGLFPKSMSKKKKSK